MASASGDIPKDQGSVARPGDLVAGHYRVERVIGSGGMGVVVAARDERNGDAVAVKLLRSIDDTRSVDRFFREARAMGRLESEHVVRVRDAGTDGKKPYLVMDRLEGIDLSERTKRSGKLPVTEAVDYVLQACEALSHAHSKGIVHRDVKPSNLFLHTEGGRTILKVLDFGISKVQTRDVWERTLTTTDDGGVLGSPPYMSPEQVRDPKAVDPRSDVWSLGVVMYKILSGSVPYDGESVGEVFAKVLERPYPSLRTTTDVPAEIDAIVERCLAKDRDVRWHHVGELAEALAPFASPEHAALAPRIAQRMHDEGPTIERVSAVPEMTPIARDGRGEPKTMTLSEPPPVEARGSAPPPARASSVPPPPISSAPAPALSSLPPPPALPSVPTANTSSMDVVAVAPGRARIAMLVGVVGVVAVLGVGIGFVMRGSSGPTSARPEEPPASSTPASTSTPSAAAAPSAIASATADPPATSASAVTSSKAGRPPRTRKPGTGTGTGTGGTPSATVRPELQPSPYPTTH